MMMMMMACTDIYGGGDDDDDNVIIDNMMIILILMVVEMRVVMKGLHLLQHHTRPKSVEYVSCKRRNSLTIDDLVECKPSIETTLMLHHQ